METYEYVIKMKVSVEAFDEADAWDAVQDAFGVGEELGITVTDCEYREVKTRRKK